MKGMYNIKANFFFFLISLFTLNLASAQPEEQLKRPHEQTHDKVHQDGSICYTMEFQGKLVVPPPKEFLEKRNASNTRTKANDIFEIDYNASGLPDSAQIAFDYALDIWASVIDTDVPIKVRVEFIALENNQLGGNILEVSDYITNFNNVPLPNNFYPPPMAEKISRQEINGNDNDILIRFNRNIDWYFGLDQNVPSNKFDFVTVSLHELGHGLGFRDLSTVTDEGLGVLIPTNYTFFMTVAGDNDRPVHSYENQSVALGDVLTGQNGTLIFKSSQIASGAVIYTPSDFNGGSSIGHLDQDTYSGTQNGLMAPRLSPGLSIHSPGISGLMLQDMGWEMTYLEFDPIANTEDIEQTFDLITTVTSDVEYDTTTLMLHYSKDSFQTEETPIPLAFTGNPGEFSATIPALGAEGGYGYYVTVNDAKGRVFSNPGLASEFFFQNQIGTDSEPPEISHTTTDFILATEEKLEITAIIEDAFMGLNNAYVEYSVNDVQQPNIPMVNTEKEIYNASIPVAGSLNGGDIIRYRIVAVDNAIAQNTAFDPVNDLYEVSIVVPAEPAVSYENDFNSASSDFLGNSFSIRLESGFEDPAIHSIHPYEEAGDGNEVRYIYQLRIPIIISTDNPIMKFDEVVLVEPGEIGTVFGDDEFWDYVVVQGSANDGITWLPLADGYDSRDDPTWSIRYDNGLGNDPDNPNLSTSIGDQSLYKERTINLTSNGIFRAGDIILIRFLLFSDPFAAGWGWAIDNLRIQTDFTTGIEDVLAEESELKIYPNPSSSGKFFVNATLKNRTARGNIVVRNVLGKTVLNKDLVLSNGVLSESLDLTGQPAGVYLITTVLDRENATYKVIKTQ